MKSLEIVNALLLLDEISEVNIPNFKNHLRYIKQDLEVLEIIRKKIVDVKLLRTYIFSKTMTIRGILSQYNKRASYNGEGTLTMEELLKLKQWLEENE